MLLAVLEKRGGLRISACDAYLNIIGGLWLDEPAADLAAVVALASSYLDRPVPGDLVAIGEVGLTGELRTVSQLAQRVSEARRLGFKKCVIPAHRLEKLGDFPGTGNQTHSHHPFLTSYPDSGTLSAGAGIRAGWDKRARWPLFCRQR